MLYNAAKNLTPLYVEEKVFSKGWGKKSNPNQTHTSPQKWNGQLQKNELEIVGLYILLLDFFFHTQF